MIEKQDWDADPFMSGSAKQEAIVTRITIASA
jgi:hypothetical protein